MIYFELINWVKQRKNKESGVMADITKCGVFSSRDVEKEIVRLEKRVEVLKQLKSAFPGTTTDWLKGVFLIPDSFFLQHAKAVAVHELGLANGSPKTWPLSYVNWEDAISALQKNYFSIDSAGVRYWVKNPE
jgi:hypothetical protein